MKLIALKAVFIGTISTLAIGFSHSHTTRAIQAVTYPAQDIDSGLAFEYTVTPSGLAVWGDRILGQHAEIQNRGGVVSLRVKVSPPTTTRVPRASRVEGSALWPHGVIVYSFHPSVSAQLKKIFEYAFDYIMQRTPIVFIKRTPANKKYYPNFVIIKIEDLMGSCGNSYLGMIDFTEKEKKQSQELVISTLCQVKGTVFHEIMHLLGFDHEYQRSDRDNYIKPNPLFQHHTIPTLSYISTQMPFDYKSITHHNNKELFSSTQPDKILLRGNGLGLPSVGDINSIRVSYRPLATPYLPPTKLMYRNIQCSIEKTFNIKPHEVVFLATGPKLGQLQLLRKPGTFTFNYSRAAPGHYEDFFRLKIVGAFGRRFIHIKLITLPNKGRCAQQNNAPATRLASVG